MAAVVLRKPMRLGTVVAVLGVAIALPFTLLHPLLPFVVLLLWLGFVSLLQRWRWISHHESAHLIGGLVALLLLLPTTTVISFAEQGFDDGPFYGRAYEGAALGENASDRLEYRQGELLIYNRQPNEAPVLEYRIAGKAQWIHEMDVSQTPHYKGYQLSAIREPQLASGLLRDRLNFQGTWNFGVESGRAYIWKWDGFHRFFLSW